ncbi:MAG: DUF2723 domain-containing protein [Salibacter sp.]|uniref:protein O-mannosyl-transferase family n=1 Tax=Salibacter sp. TaxID=2010995 RepID=UPI00286FCB24|nr:DUF2723 domain-containing protein [Salibacter sp.]MDR9397709.1 DUF2723 domain-containing protein [Salibacter sp.]
MDFKKLNIIGGWVTFAIAFVVYAMTIEPTTSFWDCGEYIATSYKLEVGHPPGAPTFMILGRIFTLLVDPQNVAVAINIMSALSSALTILFMFWSLTYLAGKFVRNEELSGANGIAIIGSAIIGSLAFTFSDTFWFSAVEGEVYGMSSFCTALVFWAILKWESIADQPHSTKWLILIFYIIGLSIGVHLLNLLAIPAILFVYYFKRFEPTRKGMIITFILSVVLLGFIQMILIPQVVNISAKFELLFANGLGTPFHVGSAVFGILLIAAIAFGLWYTQKHHKVIANTSILAFTVLMIGYTSFAMIVIRSNADTPIDENNPENMVNLLSYLKREQYGDVPLVKGHYFNSPLDNQDPYDDGSPVYYPNEETGEYEIADPRENSIPNYADEFETLFPRMWSSKSNHVRAYKAWSDFEGNPMRYRDVQSGEMKTIYKPTMGENLKYFFNYQIYWMWGRYFLWNFAGRQNDIQGHGIDQNQFTDGNWLSGIPFIDEARLGNMDEYPDELKDKWSYNKYYLLPLILGLIGLFFQYKYDKRNTLVVFLLFFFTGIAIAIYLNNYPYQPRERDYAFVGSFYAFALWIGLGVMGLYRHFRDKINPKALAAGTTLVCLLAVPVLMASENWDDHDRSDRYTAREIAKNYLDSCAPNAILFTNGDNDTFPLWYLQEVEGYRTDVRVVNLMLLNTDWYIEQMARKAYDGDPIPISMTPDQYRQGTRDFVRFGNVRGIDKDKYYDIKKIIPVVTKDKYKQPLGNGQKDNIVPTKKFKLNVPKEKVMANGTVDPSLEDQILDEITWKANGRYILKNEMVMWDILANFNWDRPLYFSITMGNDAFYGLEDYFQQEGFAFRLVPIKTQNTSRRRYGRVATETMYDNMMNKFDWGGYSDPEVFMDENNLRFVTNIRFTFSRLAQNLANKGDKERAEKVLDRVVDITVNDRVPYDGTLLPVAEQYYNVGNNEKANELMRKIIERESQFANYYLSLDQNKLSVVKPNLEQSIGIMGNAVMLATQKYPQSDEIQQEFQSKYQEIAQRYQSMGRIQ